MDKTFRLATVHATGVFINKKLILTQDDGDGSRPIYVTEMGGGELTLVLPGNKNEYVKNINGDLSVELVEEAKPINKIDNEDGSISLKFGEKFIGAKKTSGALTLSDANEETEHFFLRSRTLVNVDAYDICQLKTFYHTGLLVDKNRCINFIAAARLYDFPVYAQRSGAELSFFVVINNVVKYIRSIDAAGNVCLVDERVPVKSGRFAYVSSVGKKDPKMEQFKPYSPLEFNNNELDNTIYIRQNEQHWSALRDWTWDLRPWNRACEHFRLKSTNYIDLDNPDVILLVTDLDALDGALARLNLDRVNVKAVLIDGLTTEALEKIQTEKSIPTFDFNSLERFLLEGRNCPWLMIGNDLARLEKMSEYLQRRGLARSNIVNFSIKMNIAPRWLENMNAAVKDDCDFIVTGDRTTELGLKTDWIVNHHGVNLSADGQDLRQSHLIAQAVLKNNSKIKFVLIGLTPQLLSARDVFSDCGSDGQYIFVDDNATLEQKIFDRLLNPNIEIVANCEDSDQAVAQNHPLETMIDEAPVVDLNEKNLRRLEEFIHLCIEHNVRPIGVMMPLSPQLLHLIPNEKLALMRRVLRALETPDGFTFIDLCELPLGSARFCDMTTPNDSGAMTFTNVLNYELCNRGVLPIKDMCLVDYERLYGLMSFLDIAQFKDMLNKIFAATVETLKLKERIKVGFVLYDSAMWCGDNLYNLFAQDERYEITVIVCLQRKFGGPLIKKNHARDVEMFKKKGFTVVNVVTNDDQIPQQDVLIYLTPYFHYLPPALRTYNITAETLLVYFPYGLDMAYLSMVSFKIHFIVWKLFTDTKWLRQNLIEHNRVDGSRICYSGLPKLDAVVSPKEINFEWKMARPNAVKIIWAPHWSIKGRSYIKLSTFHMNYQFMYEYAAAHPETSWVVKPHPNLFQSAVSTGVFKSSAEFQEYLDQWNALPNANVVIGGYYQDAFATADGMIHDCCSFVGEYQYTHKPMLYLTRKTTKLNPLGTKIIDAGYKVDGSDFDGIKKFIEDVLINKNDIKAKARRKVFDVELDYWKENGMSASEKIFKTIDQALRG